MAKYELPPFVIRMFIMTVLEIKGYAAAYKEILCFWLTGLIIGGVLFLSIGEIAERGSLFEPFTIGVVDNDGAPELIFNKAPSAGLYDGQTDEADMGVSYAVIDKYLLKGTASPHDLAIIERYHAAGAHKRKPPLLFDPATNLDEENNL